MIESCMKETFVRLRATRDLSIVDVHVHPVDVMGHVHYAEYGRTSEGMFCLSGGTPPSSGQCGPSLGQRLGFGLVSEGLTWAALRFVPNRVRRQIMRAYSEIGTPRMLHEMDLAGIDKAVMLPIEPWAPFEVVVDSCKDNRLIVLGSIDLHRISRESIPELVAEFRQRGVPGIKLHPNLQGFRPQPRHNPPDIARKLKTLYTAVQENCLYLHFHGGTSSFAKKANARFPETKRVANAALLSSFVDPDGRSEVFETCNVPIIIAHLGHFGLHHFDGQLLRAITDTYGNVYFDTSAASAKRIRLAIAAVGSKRLLLGSDGLYNSMAHSVQAVFKAAESCPETLCDILGGNFKSIMAAGKSKKEVMFR